MKQKLRQMGGIDIDSPRDFYKETGPTDINVYEDLSLKNRPIGFIWPTTKLIKTNV